MRIKINGKDIDPGDRVTFESSDYPDSLALVIALIGLGIILWIASGGLLL